MNWADEYDKLGRDCQFKIEEAINSYLETLSKYMKKNNLNQKKLAEKLEISSAAVSKLLNGNENISLKRMVEIGYKLGFDVEVIEKEIGKVNVKISNEIVKALIANIDSPNNIDMKEYLDLKINNILSSNYLYLSSLDEIIKYRKNSNDINDKLIDQNIESAAIAG